MIRNCISEFYLVSYARIKHRLTAINSSGQTHLDTLLKNGTRRYRKTYYNNRLRQLKFDNPVIVAFDKMRVVCRQKLFLYSFAEV